MTTRNTLYSLCVLASLTSIVLATQIELGAVKNAGFPEPVLFGLIVGNVIFIVTCIRLARGVKKSGQK